MNPKLVKTLVYALGVLAWSSVGAESSPCPPPQSYVMRGLTVQASVGPAFWTGKVGKASRVGIAVQLQTGYDLASWLSLVFSWSSGIHSTDQAYPPAQDTFATHAVHTGVRLGLPVNDIDISLIGGVGILWSRPDVLVRIPEFDGNIGFGWLGGFSFIWHTSRRRFWLGVQATAMGSNHVADIWIVGSGLIGVTL